MPAVKMPFMMNPFAKHDVSDFPGVLVPLDQAHRHVSVVDKKDNKLDPADGAATETAGPQAGGEYSAFTIESLRAEIDDDLAASGVNSTYDRT